MSGSEGRTVIFVSHNMQSIQQLCSKVGVLNNGKLIKEGKASEMILIAGIATSVRRVISMAVKPLFISTSARGIANFTSLKTITGITGDSIKSSNDDESTIMLTPKVY